MRRIHRVPLTVALAGLSVITALAGAPRAIAEEEVKPPERVGQIYIITNDRTPQDAILRSLPLYPGQVFSYPDVRQAEKNLCRLIGLTWIPDGALRPEVTVLDNPFDPDNPVKDILVNMQETSSGSLMFGVGVNSDSGLTGSVILNERNFDLLPQKPAASTSPGGINP